MKMNKELLQDLERMIDESLNKYGLSDKQAQLSYIESLKKKNGITDARTEFRWNVFHGMDDHQKIPFIRSVEHNGLDFNDITDALEVILPLDKEEDEV